MAKQSHMAGRDPDGLTVKQSHFVLEYLKDGVGAAAARRAGYAPKNARGTAAHLLTLPHVQASLNRRMKKRLEKVEVDAEWVLKRLMIEAEREGDAASHSARIAALSHIGKHLNMFIERVESKNETVVSFAETAQAKVANLLGVEITSE